MKQLCSLLIIALIICVLFAHSLYQENNKLNNEIKLLRMEQTASKNGDDFQTMLDDMIYIQTEMQSYDTEY